MSDARYNFVNQTGDEVTFMLVNPDHTEGPHNVKGHSTYASGDLTPSTRIVGVWWEGKDELYPNNTSPFTTGANFSSTTYIYTITLTTSGLTVS